MDEQNPREELYNQFKASLKEPVSERYFSEDELVMIFDYAGDLADDYAQFEVLFCAARLYPESQPLIDRKALFYLDTTESDENPESPTAKAFLADNPEMASPIMDIIRMEVNHPENPTEALDFFLEQYQTLGDEEVIRLIDLACNLGEYEWVRDNLENIRKKISYAPTLLYEMMNRATEAQDFETAVKVTEELIEGEPFSAGYWSVLFRAQAKLGKEEEARMAFEYAKDLGASDEDIIVFLTEIIVECAPYLIEDGIAMLDDWLSVDPSNYRIFTARGTLLLNNGNADQLEADLLDFIEKNGVNTQAIRHLFLLGHVGTGEIFLNELRKGRGQFSYSELEDLVDNLHINGNHIGMVEIMDAMDQMMEPPMSLPLAQYKSEAMYHLKRYQEVIDLFKSYSEDEVFNFLNFPPRGPAYWFVVLKSLIKLRVPPFIYIDVQKLFNAIVENMTVAPEPVKITYLSLLQLVMSIMEHPVTDTDFWADNIFLK